MLQETITIVNKLGLHARAAAKLVKLASTFSSEIHLKRKQREVNGKSIMGVMLLAAGKGTEVELSVSGDDEEQAFQKVAELIKSGFGEDE